MLQSESVPVQRGSVNVVVRSSQATGPASCQTVHVTNQEEQVGIDRSVSLVVEEEDVYWAHGIGRNEEQ